MHQCNDQDADHSDNYPGTPKDGVKEPRCLVNTGDFRVVLADSNGDKIDEDKSHKMASSSFSVSSSCVL